MEILQDTREKNGWSFFPETVLKHRLPCGDYTSSLLLATYAIERKASTGEVYMNLGRVKNLQRFHREIDKLLLLDSAVCIMEFSEADIAQFPENSNIPRYRSPSKYEVAAGKYKAGERVDAWGELRINGRHLRTLINQVSDRIPVIYCGSRRNAEQYALEQLRDLESKL